MQLLRIHSTISFGDRSNRSVRRLRFDSFPPNRNNPTRFRQFNRFLFGHLDGPDPTIDPFDQRGGTIPQFIAGQGSRKPSENFASRVQISGQGMEMGRIDLQALDVGECPDDVTTSAKRPKCIMPTFLHRPATVIQSLRKIERLQEPHAPLNDGAVKPRQSAPFTLWRVTSID